jgi:hypothetical protein
VLRALVFREPRFAYREVVLELELVTRLSWKASSLPLWTRPQQL